MKSVLISIQPYWVFLIIANLMGWNIDKEKTVEVRKNYPKAENWDKIAKIYCSKNKRSFAKIPKEYQPLMERFLGKVIGEFVCNRCGAFPMQSASVRELSALSLVPAPDLYKYAGANTELYGWHISDFVIYDEPKDLGEFFHACDKQKGTDCSVCIDRRENTCKTITRPPQSWCYVEG